ncbi:hypothetical protein V7152_17375 [Neobacillus drentensis]|uniref:hypothetical protein n=1 Tax=Neobacillus drentensis TaxID=220684 RepID=UPI002FFEC7A6
MKERNYLSFSVVKLLLHGWLTGVRVENRMGCCGNSFCCSTNGAGYFKKEK